MHVKIAINGFGRIGRLILRELITGNYPGLDVVMINDASCSKVASHLLKYDSTHGTMHNTIEYDEDSITIDGKRIKYTSDRNIENLSFCGIDLVLECTGKFKSSEACANHFRVGAKKVLISAPGENVDFTVVYGVNDDKLTANHKIISNASCTTNCLAPVVKVLDESVGIECGHMVTVHSYTGDQKIVDTGHTDLRRARAAASNIVPTSTGAAKAIGLIFPHLSGKLHGAAVRVPVQDVSLIDMSFIAKRDTSADEINNLMRQASCNALKNVLAYNDIPLVSSDFITSRASAVFDATQTSVTNGRLCSVLAWYDNEYGFSCRMLDVANVLASLST